MCMGVCFDDAEQTPDGCQTKDYRVLMRTEPEPKPYPNSTRSYCSALRPSISGVQPTADVLKHTGTGTCNIRPGGLTSALSSSMD